MLPRKIGEEMQESELGCVRLCSLMGNRLLVLL